MNMTSERYSAINGSQLRDCGYLLQQIKEEVLDNHEKVGVILDVGCGSGNVTKIMADFIPHDRILSFDIDEGMVQAATDLLGSDPSFDIFVQDIGVPFEKLNPKLRELEGKVDLIWSNRVLHWVPDHLRPVVASNLIRLLKPSGRLYMNITLVVDFNEFLPAAEKEANEKLLKIPSRQEQQTKWTNYFKNAGLSSLDVKYFSKVWEHCDDTLYETTEDSVHLVGTYLPPDLSQEERTRILNGFKPIYKRSWATPLGTPLVDEVPKGYRIYYYGQFRVTGRK